MQQRTADSDLPATTRADRHEEADARAERRLIFALLLTAGIVLVEAVGGLLANSLSLLSDAGHVLTDLVALGMALFALRQARRPADARRTFGYHRVGILTALVNAAGLIPISVILIYEAVSRLFLPLRVDSGIMLGVAAVGLVANLLIGATLHRAAHGNLNMQSAVLHVMGDALASAGVLVGALVIGLTGWVQVDPMLSIAISCLIAFSGLRLLRSTVHILLESVPAGIDVEEVVGAMLAVPGVRDVHDLHIWQLSPGINALSCHVLIDDQLLSRGGDIVAALDNLLAERFAIGHSTIQPECLGCDPETLYCVLTPRESAQVHQH